MPLLDQFGRPITEDHRKRRRASPPPELITGDRLGQWAGQNLMYLQLPGGTVLQFDLDKLTMADFRQMRNHYQLSASLRILTFMMHQLDWKIECKDQAIADMIETNIRSCWTRLIRALSQAFWAGFSPNCLVYENNPLTGYLEIDKVKDLIPEQCCVNWKETEGAILPGPGGLDVSESSRIPPKILNFNGIKHNPISGWFGDGGHGPWAGGYGASNQSVIIPPDNSLWYPMLMENGDFYGTKLLKPAFPAYYFSQLIHLFANRYYERYGEPTPVGRANYEDEITVSTSAGDTQVNGKRYLEQILNSLRNRSVVVLPSDRDPETKEYEYDIEYLESEMRGADFEKYLSRLDEEMSLAVFTPVLLFRTAEVGSYNLGNIHVKVFDQMLNSVAGDMKEYIDNYVVDRLREFNFGSSAPAATWEFRPLGKGDMQTYQLMLQQLVSGNIATPNLEELSVAVGITMEKAEQVLAPPAPNSTADPVKARANLKNALDQAVTRVGREVANSWSNGRKANLGYRSHFESGLRELGYDAEEITTETTAFYGRINQLIKNLVEVATSPEEVRDSLGRAIEYESERFISTNVT